MEETLQSFDYLVSQFLCLNRSIWSKSDDADTFLETVDDLIATVHELDNTTSDRTLLDRSDSLLERCASRLLAEFQHLIETAGFDFEDSDHVEEPHSGNDNSIIPVARLVMNFDVVVDALPEGVVFEANRIARRMVAAGFGNECTDAYTAARYGYFEESIARLGVHVRAAEELRSASWEELEAEVSHWIPAFRAVFLILIPSEHSLSGRVFEGLATYGENAFAAAFR